MEWVGVYVGGARAALRGGYGQSRGHAAAQSGEGGDHALLTAQVLPVVNHVFRAMDTDGSGLVDFRELFTCLGQVVMGSTLEKAAFYFSLCASTRPPPTHTHR